MFEGTTRLITVVALLAGSLRQGMAQSAGGAWLRRAAGGLFVGLGLKLAFGVR